MLVSTFASAQSHFSSPDRYVDPSTTNTPHSIANFEQSIIEAAAPLGPQFLLLSMITRGPTLFPSTLACLSKVWQPVIIQTMQPPPPGLPLHITSNVAYIRWRHTVADLLLDHNVACTIESTRDRIKAQLREQMETETPGLSDILIGAKRRVSPSPASSQQNSPRLRARLSVDLAMLKARSDMSQPSSSQSMSPMFQAGGKFSVNGVLTQEGTTRRTNFDQPRWRASISS